MNLDSCQTGRIVLVPPPRPRDYRPRHRRTAAPPPPVCERPCEEHCGLAVLDSILLTTGEVTA